MVAFVNAYSLSYYMFITYKELETVFKLDGLKWFLSLLAISRADKQVILCNYLTKCYKQLDELM